MPSQPPRRRLLYISYDGVLEPLGESQVVAYLERLGDRASMTLLSFEKAADLAAGGRVGAMRARLAGAGITWIARRHHQHPAVLSTVFDVLAGWRAVRSWAGEGPPGIIHARGYEPAIIALAGKRSHDARFIFDMRGFRIDEQVEAGRWARGGLWHRLGKRCERRVFESADAIVSLTHAAVHSFPVLGRVGDAVLIEVIPTCADLDRFRPASDAASEADAARRRKSLGLEGATVVGCVGTLSTWYLREETLSYLGWLTRRFERMKVLMVTREDHDALRADAIRLGLPADRLVLIRAPFDEMPAWMRIMDVGVLFIRVCFSKRASAATKLAEFLGSGVPVIINDGIGDSGEIVRNGAAGVVLAEATPAWFDRSADAVVRLLADSAVRARCRRVAEQEFSLTDGVARYGELYDRLFGLPGTP